MFELYDTEKLSATVMRRKHDAVDDLHGTS
jgi:hypothetical protein